MAERRDYFFRQLVTEAELDAGFTGLELADRNLAVDHGLIGVVTGLGVAQQVSANLTVQVLAGVAYDQSGQRCTVGSTQSLDCSVDEDSVSTAVATPGNTKILSVFLGFDRALSDLRIDGNSDPVYFIRAESFELRVVQGAEGVSPTAPALLGDAILLADITRTEGVSVIVDADISTERKEWAFVAQRPFIEVGTAEEAIALLAAGAFPGDLSVPAASDFQYATPRQIDFVLPISLARPNRGGSTNWSNVMGVATSAGWSVSAGDATEHILHQALNGFLPLGCEITRYSVDLDQSVSASVLEIGYFTSGGTGLVWTSINSAGPIGITGGADTYNSGALSHVMAAGRQYYVRVRANAAQVSVLSIHEIRVRALVSALAP